MPVSSNVKAAGKRAEVINPKVILLHPKFFGDYEDIVESLKRSFVMNEPYPDVEATILNILATLLLRGSYDKTANCGFNPIG